jgi:hypothetical protein
LYKFKREPVDWGFTARKRNGKTMFFVITLSVIPLIPENKKICGGIIVLCMATVAQSTQLLFTFTI